MCENDKLRADLSQADKDQQEKSAEIIRLRAENERLKEVNVILDRKVMLFLSERDDALRAHGLAEAQRDAKDKCATVAGLEVLQLRADLGRLRERADARDIDDASSLRKLETERDLAIRARDLAREASNRDLEAKRVAEAELTECRRARIGDSEIIGWRNV